MRRAILAVVGTVAGLVVLLSYKTHPIDASHLTVVLDSPPALIEPRPTPSASATASAPPHHPSDHRGHHKSHRPRKSPTPMPSASSTTTPTASSRPTHRPTNRPTHRPTHRPTNSPKPSPTVPSPSPTSAPGTFTGSAIRTIYGNVQVRISVSNGQITGVSILQIPDQDDMDRDVNDHAVPILIQETLDAQSADIAAVSGATYTSAAYVQSLQSAIDAASL